MLALNHPNIVTVYDIGEADGIYYIASELIEGETLRDGAVARQPRAGAIRGHRDPGLHGARRRARQGRRAPGHQARKRDAARRRLRQGARLRHRQAHRAVWRTGSRRRRGRGEPRDGRWPHRRHDAVHVAGAGARRPRGCAHRRVELRRAAVRDAERARSRSRAAAPRMCSPGSWSASPRRSRAWSKACRRNCSASSRGP